MQVWHGTPDAPQPQQFRPGEIIDIVIGTWPIEPGQEVTVELTLSSRSGVDERREVVAATWYENAGSNSYWRARIGPFRTTEQISYSVHGQQGGERVVGPSLIVPVADRLPVALLWHFHQPLYRQDSPGRPPGYHRMPWVRLHGLRDYYAMPALLLEHPEMHATINITPVLLDQLLDYAEGRAWDDALALTRTPAGRLTASDRELLLGTFFEAHWHGQIFPHRRYTELFTRRLQGLPFKTGDLRDLQVWFALAWFNQVFREGPVPLVTGETTEVHRLVEKERDFSLHDVEAVVAEQAKVLRAIVPLLRRLEKRGQVELSTTPYYHPILPLLINSASAAAELPPARLPARFAYPEDAVAQVRLALARHAEVFGQVPAGVWPAEGAVSQAAGVLLARQGLRWLVSDAGVLARSGASGYGVDQPGVATRPYRAGEGANTLVAFFRDPWLSDRIGFDYHHVEERAAADHFVAKIKERSGNRLTSTAGQVVTIALDGENRWGAYRGDGRTFLQALYQRLSDDAALVPVTFSEFLDGNAERGLAAHPAENLELLQPLATGSWIDEPGSQPGVDLGTWIGEPEENAAWELLTRTREQLSGSPAGTGPAVAALRTLYAAEGSDWFWWFGRDQDSGQDQEFDDLFRAHLQAAYRAYGRRSPRELGRHLVPHTVTWSFVAPVAAMQENDELVIVTNCPGSLEWRFDGGVPRQSPLFPVRGTLGGLGRHRLNLAPVPSGTRLIEFRFRCAHEGCAERSPCRDASWRSVNVLAAGGRGDAPRPEASTSQ